MMTTEEWNDKPCGDPRDAEIARLTAERDRFEEALGRACLVGATTYLIERAEKAEADRDTARRWLGELLAIIHRDGGHYQAEHGNQKAVEDAHQVWADLMQQIDAARAEIEVWRRMSIDSWAAFSAMRDHINQHLPMRSAEADLLRGPEFSVSCESVAEDVVSALATRDKATREQALRDAVDACRGSIWFTHIEPRIIALIEKDNPHD